MAAIVNPGLRILIADDNGFNREQLCRMLRRLGLGADHVADGETATRMTASVPYDVVFIDCQMSGMGSDVTAYAVREALGPSVQIIGLSGMCYAEDEIRAQHPEINSYLIRPFAMNALRDALAPALARRRPASRHRSASTVVLPRRPR